MNIVEAYTKFNGQLIIFVSGLTGCGKTSLAKEISDKFDIKLIDQYDYRKGDYDEMVTLSDETEHVNWNSDGAVDWDRFNDDINKNKKNGVIVTGMALVDDKIDAKPNVHIHLSISKQVCLSKRRKLIEKKKEEYEEDYKYINTPTETLKMNKLIYPYYLETKERSKISKFINANEMDSDQIWNAGWDLLIEFFKNNIDRVYKKWKKEHPDEDINNNDLPTTSKNNKEDDLEEDDIKFSEDDVEFDELDGIVDDSDDMFDDNSTPKDGRIDFIETEIVSSDYTYS